MADVDTDWLRLQLERARSGKSDAWNLVILWCMKRMRAQAHRMLQDFPRVRRWEDSDDIVQESMMRLMRALKVVPIQSEREFFALAATQIRRELLDLERHYSGPNGLAANLRSGHYSPAPDESRTSSDPPDHGGCSSTELSSWGRLHEAVERLETEEREVFSLVFYHGWTQGQIAELFQVDERTIRRRWQAVCQRLQNSLGGDWSRKFEDS